MTARRARAAAALLPGLLAGAAAAQAAGQQPVAVVDLATHAGVTALQTGWRHCDAEFVPVDFRSPGPDRKPTGAPNRTLDISPKAGAVDFDDSAWQVLDPTTLDDRRGAGRICCNWYRLRLTFPEQLDGVPLSGTEAWFEIVVDDYAEVWVDGALPRTLGQSGGSLVRGWNAPNRVRLSRAVRPGQQVQIAVFGINGPLSDPPANYIWVRAARVEFLPPRPATTAIERLDPRLDAIVPPDAEWETVADGFRWLEGPAWHGPGGYLLFTDIPANTVWQWRPGTEPRVFLAPSGWLGAQPFRGPEPGANGLCFDRQGRLLLCEHGERAVTRRERDGSRTVLASGYRGRRLNSPNDVIVAQSGDLWFTDPPFGLPGQFDSSERELPFGGVYRLTAAGELTLLVADLRGPNGVALSPDERTLYVTDADPQDPKWLRYPLAADGRVGPGEVFCHAGRWRDRPGFPDGMAVDAAGNLFSGGPGGVYVFAPDGTLLGVVHTGVATSNCELGFLGQELLVTAATRVLRLPLVVAAGSALPAR